MQRIFLLSYCYIITFLQLFIVYRFYSIVPQAYHPLFVLRTCASCILMAASVVYKGFCEYDNEGFLNG